MRRRTAGAVVTSVALVLIAATPVAAASRPLVPSPTVTAGTGTHATATDPSHGKRPRDRGPYGSAEPQNTDDTSAAATDHVLVRFTTKASTQQRGSALRAAGVVAGADVAGTRYLKVPVDGADPSSVVRALSAEPAVADAQLDHVRHIAGWTNDQLVQQYAWPYFDLARLPRAWDVTTGTGAVVAVLDTGVTGTVPDLAGAVLPGTDLVDGDSDPTDLNGHGTAMAGIIAAHGNNTIGSAGSAYGAKILPVRVLDASGSGDDSTIASGISWAVAHGADVINLSLAGPDPAPVILGAIQSAVSAGVVVVAAAGNDGADAPEYPAAYAPQVDGLVAVSATDDDGARPYFSTRGDWVTLAAPGVDIIGPDYASSGYVVATGTSSSAAFVSGVAALVAAHDPTASPATVESRLVQSARDAGPRGADPYYGAGVVDAAGAVTAADSTHAAVAVPLDRAASDPGPSDDTPATARRMPASLTTSGTLSPEGDVDWYRVIVPSGWWQVQVTPGSNGDQDPLDPAIEIRDTAGTVLGRGDNAPRGSTETAYALAPADHFLLVGITDVAGFASTVPYSVTVTAATPPPFRTTSQSGNGNSQALALGDVTGDGVPDALVAVAGAPVDLYVGRGDATFAPAVPVGSATTGAGVVLLDVDGDGDLDVAATTSSGVEILRQDAGTLVDGGTVPLPSGGLTIATGDLEGDGDSDLVVTGPASTISVLTNDGVGHLSVTSSITNVAGGFVTQGIGQQPTTMRLGDITGDGRLDIVGASGFSVQKSDGTFGLWSSYAFGSWPVLSAGVADVTGDGRPDVVLSTEDGKIYVLAQTAQGALADPVVYGPWGIGGPTELADFNGDGRTDVLVASDGWVSANLLLQRADGTLDAPTGTPVPYMSWYPQDGLQSADLDGDGCRDAVLLVSGLTVLHRTCASHGPAWFTDITPAPNSAGVTVRPTIRATFARALDPSTVSPATVRVRVGQSATTVPATVSYDPATTSVSVVLTADLTPGSHYEVVIDGVKDSSGHVLDEPVRTWFTVAAGAARFTPVDPVRVADTRENGWAIYPGQTVQLSFADVVPPSATSVVLNVTSTQASGPGNIRVYPAGLSSVPTISNINVVAGVDQANLVTVQLGTQQAVNFYTDGMSSYLVIDLAGYYSPDAAAGYVPLSPVRVLDTRTGTGSVPVAPLRGGNTLDLTVAGRTGVPADALAVVMNVTGTNVTGTTHLRVYPTPGAGEDQTPPEVSNVNMRAGRDQPNLVTVKVGDGGKVRFYTPFASTDVVADVVGYYTATGSNGYVPLTPTRAIDTRINQGITGMLHAGTTNNAVLAGRGDVPADATAIVLNVVGVHPSSLTHVRVFPTTSPNTLPNVSTLNLVPGRDEANLTIQPPGVGGQISFYVHSADMNLVADVSGYFRH